MNKPIVNYKSLHSVLKIGDPALVRPINHPSSLVSNTKMILTSIIVSIGNDGFFETQNTFYCKEEK